jgi:hypothetical protein
MALLCLYTTANGQAHVHFKKLQGSVVSANGKPVSGVRLELVRSGVCDSTNLRGEFTLVYPLRYDSLVATHPEFITRKILIRSKTNRVKVKLKKAHASR